MLAVYGNNKHLAAALRQAEQAGDTEFISNFGSSARKVTVPRQWFMYYRAYLRLEADRKDHHSHIPWTAIADYARFYGFSHDQSEMLMEIVEAVDNAVLAKRETDLKNGNARKSRQEAKQTGRPAGRRGKGR